MRYLLITLFLISSTLFADPPIFSDENVPLIIKALQEGRSITQHKAEYSLSFSDERTKRMTLGLKFKDVEFVDYKSYSIDGGMCLQEGTVFEIRLKPHKEHLRDFVIFFTAKEITDPAM